MCMGLSDGIQSATVPQFKVTFCKNVFFFVFAHIGMEKQLSSFRGATCCLKKQFVAVIVVKTVSLIAVITIQDKGKNYLNTV